MAGVAQQGFSEKFTYPQTWYLRFPCDTTWLYYLYLSEQQKKTYAPELTNQFTFAVTGGLEMLTSPARNWAA